MGKKRRSSGEGHVHWNARLKVFEARLYVPVKLRPLYGGKRVLPEVVSALKAHRARQNEERLALGGSGTTAASSSRTRAGA